MNITLGEFGKWKRNLKLTKNSFGRNKILCAEDNYSNTNYMCAKAFADTNFNEAVIYKISIFEEIAPNFVHSQKNVIFKV